MIRRPGWCRRVWCRRCWGRWTRRRCRGWRTVLSGAELLSAAAGRRRGRRAGGWSNAYGPTEATVMVTTAAPVGPGGCGRRRSGGRSPIRGCSCWMSGWARCRSGVAGELYVGGGGAGARLPGPARADGGAVRRRARSAAGRGSGCTGPATWPGGRPDGQLEFAGPGRRAGQDPRVPDRAGRDRGGAGRAVPGWPRPRWSSARTPRATSGWSAYVVPARTPAGRDLAAAAAGARRAPGCPSYMVPGGASWSWTRCR